jgi:predicted transglutaminase-like cysteine proteinase
LALPTKHRPIIANGAGIPLDAWVEFCKADKYKKECTFGQDEPKRIVLTEEIWSAIAVINSNVNDTTTSITDPLHWGVEDRWDLAEDGYGDCEDHQLLKRSLLADLGIPRRAMRITVVLDSEQRGHAVLMIKTDRGDFILDNLTHKVLSWEETTYVYLRQEGQNNPQEWVNLHPDESAPDTVSTNGAD